MKLLHIKNPAHKSYTPGFEQLILTINN